MDSILLYLTAISLLSLPIELDVVEVHLTCTAGGWAALGAETYCTVLTLGAIFLT